MSRRVLRSCTFAGEGMGWLTVGLALLFLGPFVSETLAWVGLGCFVVFAVVFFGD